ncbi:arylamine N-acetyltransferase [Rhodanobacter glycinis]|uniref:Arylamine N-acetyltransferase n=1 Tax=Rhodanobacter glycinis TaxID=582702 RepID=A0A502CAB5_9GAMM|nr:arylamine N-acetyltransferase [Rhodanobacter glycinis]TPG10117.1 arylamine N-acetyltransferase [Rhodanobacter glycinis]TPG50971.1 arylamine N-acetyltransferase [Rhodanobacter glycinis]
MHDAIDLQAYLRRIGRQGAARPDMPTLQAIVAAHVAAIPFENLNPLLGLPVSLELAALERKLVREGRGGYCFEQNLLLEAVLRAIGFEVSGLIARVLWTRPEDAITPQTHMLLRVELAGESWLVDVGFGRQTLVGVLRLQADIEQATPLEPFRLVQMDGDWRMQSMVRGRWLSLYRFDLRPVPPIDYVVANHYVSTHPDSNFVNHLNVARTTSDSRLSLHNREFTIRRIGHEPDRRMLHGSAAIRRVLEQEFLITLPAHLQLDQRLDNLPDNLPV